MKYYVFVPLNEDVKSVTIYDNEADAKRVAEDFSVHGLEAFVCDFGYPFA